MPLPTFKQTLNEEPDFERAKRLAIDMTKSEAVKLAQQDYLTLEECHTILQVLNRTLGFGKKESEHDIIAMVKGKADSIILGMITKQANEAHIRKLAKNQMEESA